MYNDYEFNHNEEHDNESHSDDTARRHSRPNRATRRRAGKSFGKTLGKCAAIVAICGIVGGSTFAGASALGNSLIQKSQTAAAETTEENSSETASNTKDTLKSTSDSASAISLGSSDSSDEELTTVEVASQTMPSMVAITNVSVTEVQNYYNQFGGFGNFGYYGGSSEPQTQETTSAGSGEIIYEDDDYFYIATNQHVIADATTLTVAFTDDSVAEAQIVGQDETNDLAVIKVAKADLSEDTLKAVNVISIGSSSDLVVGESLVAIGNALGYGQSVSEGIVSALNRSLESETSGVYASGLIQTDAAINPGNSGGALLNMKGQLVGINSAKYASTEVEGMGYAIPMDTAYPIFTAMINGTYDESSSDETGSYEEGDGDAYLGVSCATISSDYSTYYNIPEGVYIKEVTSNGAAAKAGIEAGDIITSFDGKSVSTSEDLSALLSQHNGGETVTVTLERSDASGNYSSMSLDVKLGSRTA